MAKEQEKGPLKFQSFEKTVLDDIINAIQFIRMLSIVSIKLFHLKIYYIRLFLFLKKQGQYWFILTPYIITNL